jgi:uncharacterized membrane protein
VNWYDWLLFLHILGAVGMLAGATFYWMLIATMRNVDRPATALAFLRMALPAGVALQGGIVLTVVFGVWLAIYVDGYEIWDGWILAAFALWALSGELGRRTGVEYMRAQELAKAAPDDVPSPELRASLRTQKGLVLHSLTSIAIVLALADMIWKPGS